MLNLLIGWSLRNRAAVLAIALGLLLVGGFLAVRMPVDVFPDLTAPTVTVITEGPGMAPEEVELLLDVFMLEKAVYELGYELNNRPDWLNVPLQGILEMLQEDV